MPSVALSLRLNAANWHFDETTYPAFERGDGLPPDRPGLIQFGKTPVFGLLPALVRR